MKSKLLSDKNGLKTFALVFDKAEDVKDPLLGFASQNRPGGSAARGHWCIQRGHAWLLRSRKEELSGDSDTGAGGSPFL
jgi:hypothetical protein